MRKEERVSRDDEPAARISAHRVKDTVKLAQLAHLKDLEPQTKRSSCGPRLFQQWFGERDCSIAEQSYVDDLWSGVPEQLQPFGGQSLVQRHRQPCDVPAWS